MKKVVAYIFLLIFSGCIESFEPSFDLDTSNVVITGIITDLSPARVEIAKPVSRQEKKMNIKRISGARVILFDDKGNHEQLTEVGNGFYEGMSKGIAGRKYHINVQLPDNRIITSSPQLLKPCPSIESISFEQISYIKSIGSTVKVNINGLNLNLYMNQKDTLSQYYKWKIGGTYKRYTAFDFNFLDPPCYVVIPEDYYFVLGESLSNNSDLFSKTLKFITPDGKYAYGQSVEVAQYTLTKEAYDYWKKIEDQQENVGSVFDPPPAQIIGNLNYIDNTNIPALGFFEVSGVKKKRIFISPTDFLGLTEGSAEFSTAGIDGQCFPPQGFIGEWIYPTFCEDCSLLDNSTTIKPPYWP